MVRLYINNRVIYTKPNTTVIQVCLQIKIEITKFCYHPSFSIAGNCRICLIEIVRFPKPVAACSIPVTSNIIVFTDSPIIKKVQESVIEF